MRMNWESNRYTLILDSVSERNLIVQTVIEAAYSVNRLPDREYVTRLGSDPAEIHEFIHNGWSLPLSISFSVEDVELLKSCFVETLFFFSAADYEMRTGWTLENGWDFFRAFMTERSRITVERQWPDPIAPS